ncbi:hypothetical protein CBL_01107 [Carabus blaptoides fortunei]
MADTIVVVFATSQNMEHPRGEVEAVYKKYWCWDLIVDLGKIRNESDRRTSWFRWLTVQEGRQSEDMRDIGVREQEPVGIIVYETIKPVDSPERLPVTAARNC